MSQHWSCRTGQVTLTAEEDTTGSAGLERIMQEYNDAGTDYTDPEKRTWANENSPRYVNIWLEEDEGPDIFASKCTNGQLSSLREARQYS